MRANIVATYLTRGNLFECKSEEERLTCWNHLRLLVKQDLIFDKRKRYLIDNIGQLRCISTICSADRSFVYTSYASALRNEVPEVGVYRLNFDDGEFYIGKSTNIVTRYRSHISKLKSGNTSKKMWPYKGQRPILEILEECQPYQISLLDAAERYWIEKLDARKSLNTV